MQLKRLKLRKNNWSTEAYRFDEVFTETASQKRIYEVVAKPVVEVTHEVLKTCLFSIISMKFLHRFSLSCLSFNFFIRLVCSQVSIFSIFSKRVILEMFECHGSSVQ